MLSLAIRLQPMNLVLDLGQSGARVRINGVDSQFNKPKNSAEPIVQTLRRIFEEIPAQKFETVYLSLTGLQGTVPDVAPYGNLCHEFFSAARVAVMDDGIAAYDGAIGSRDGVVLTLGSGIVAIAGNHGRFAHADGKGPIFGDYGGGFWIGKYGLSRAISTLDGRDDATDLVSLLSSELSDYRALADTTGTDAALLCIKSAKTIIQGAENSVASAALILNEAAHHLARTINSAWSKTNPSLNDQIHISYLGGLSQSDFYTDLISTQVKKLLPSAIFIAPEGNHLDGAPRVAEKFPNGMKPLLDWWQL